MITLYQFLMLMPLMLPQYIEVTEVDNEDIIMRGMHDDILKYSRVHDYYVNSFLPTADGSLVIIVGKKVDK